MGAKSGCECDSKACPGCADTYTRAHVDELSDQVMELTAERDKKAEFIEGLMEELGQVRELHGADLELLDEARAEVKRLQGCPFCRLKMPMSDDRLWHFLDGVGDVPCLSRWLGAAALGEEED